MHDIKDTGRRSHGVLVLVAAFLALALLASSAGAATSETRSTVEFGPDLAVSAGDITLSKSVLLSGVAFNVSVKVYNLGDEDAFDVTVDLLVDTEPVMRKSLDEILVDGWAITSFTLSLDQGDHDIGILVDADDAIDERREDNNDASLQVRVRGLPDAVVTDSDLSVSNAHPMEGDVLTIGARVHNVGESAATLVVVQFWDGLPEQGELIANRTTSVPEGGSQLVTTQWDTTGLGGTHEVHVYLARVLPSEEVLENNHASITVLVFTHWDLVIDDSTGDVTIDQEWTQDGFVTVRDGRTLTISGISFDFLQEYPNQFALFVEDGAMLVLEGALVGSAQDLLLILEDGTSLHMSSGSELYAQVLVEGDASVHIEESTLVGGISGNATSVSLVASTITGPLELTSGVLTVEGCQLTAPSATVLSRTQAVMVDTVIEGATPSLMLYDGAVVELRNVTCGDVVADELSKAMVFRRVEVLVLDESSLVVPGAEVEVRHFINGSTVGSAQGSPEGRAWIEVLSDVIEGGESHFIGNYVVWSSFSGEEGTEPLLLTPFPAMDALANLPQVVVMLPPVEPSSIMSSTPGDLVIEAGQDLELVANYVQDGNIVVKGTLTVSLASLSVLQDREHQFYVVVEGNGRLVLDGGSLTSQQPLNVYLHDQARLELTQGSVMRVNALVSKGSATVMADGAQMEARLLLRGGQVEMGGGCHVKGDVAIIEGPTVFLTGGSLQVDRLYVDSPSATIQDLDITAREVEIHASFANITDSSLSLETLRVEATILMVMGSTIDSQESLNLTVATFYMDSSSSNRPLVGDREDSKIYLYDAQVPRPFAEGGATVLVYWYLTVVVEDVLGNPVAGSDIDITYTKNDTAVTSGVSNDDGQVRFPLLGSIVDTTGERFVGNYMITAHSPKDQADTVVRYINLDRAKTMVMNFDTPMVPPTMISVEIFVANTTLLAGTTFHLSGTATAVFPTLRTLMYEGSVEVQLWNNASSWSDTTQVRADGTFELEVPAPMADGVYYIKAVVTPTGDFTGVSPGVSRTITLDVSPPTPTSLFVILTPNKIVDFPVGNLLVVRGTVRYNTAQGEPAPNVRVLLEDPLSQQTYQTQADGLGVFEFPGRVGPTYFGQYDYKVTAQDDELGIGTLAPVKLTVLAVEVEEEEEEGPNYLLWIGFIIIIAVAIILGTLGYWAVSTKGRMVECGECGTLVPETATRCPRCDTEFEIEVAKCSVCESWIRSDADVCPTCNTPFRDLGEVKEEAEAREAAPPPPSEDAPVTVEAELDEGATGEVVDVMIDDEVTTATVKQVPEGLRKEVRPRPVVQRKAVKEPVSEDLGGNGAETGNDVPATPRPVVLKRVAAPPTGAPEAPSAPEVPSAPPPEGDEDEDVEFDSLEDEEES